MISQAFSVAPILYILIPLSFILGSIPFGILFTKSRGIDLKSTGSKNIGATNVLRAAGKVPALMTLLADMLKGMIPIIICRYIIANADFSRQTPEFYALVKDLWSGIIGLSSVLGHMFSVFLSFKGGKGVATGFGVLLIYSPAVACIILLVWLLTAFIFRYSSLAAIIAVTAMPVIFILLGSSTVKVSIGIILAALIVFKHTTNIKNLLAGTESRIGDKNKK